VRLSSEPQRTRPGAVDQRLRVPNLFRVVVPPRGLQVRRVEVAVALAALVLVAAVAVFGIPR
jgi:hypothetical protein